MKRVTMLEKLQEEALEEMIFSLIFNLVLLIGGATLISLAFGWQVGVGTALFLMFIKGGK
jgi:hypothetical protein